MVSRPSGPTGTILRLAFGAKGVLDRMEIIGKGPVRQVARGAKDTVLALLEGGRLISISSRSPYEAKGVQIETRQDLDPWFKRSGWALAAAPDGSLLLANPWAIRVLWPAKDASPLLVDQPGESTWAPVWPFPAEGFLAWPAPEGTEEETKAK